MIITSNLVFSEWDRIFKDPMTTAAAIDRLVHHAVILEMVGKSVRAEEAAERAGTNGRKKPTPPTTTNDNKRNAKDEKKKGATTTKKRTTSSKESTTTGEM